MLIPLAMLASLGTSVTPFGGTRSDPVVVPLQGSLSGFQATYTTRWIRFETPTCTRFQLKAAFSRRDVDAATFEGVKEAVRLWCDTDEPNAVGVDCQPLEFDSNGATTDVGIRVRTYASTKLTWTSAPCPVIPVAPGLSAPLRDALFGWKSRPTSAELRAKLAAAGVEFHNDDGKPDPMGDAARVDLAGKSFNLSFVYKPGGANLSLAACEFESGFEELSSLAPSILAAVGPPTVRVKAASWSQWRAKNPYVAVKLRLQECGHDESDATRLEIRYGNGGVK